ncbi:uncharacterized protein LOC117652780 [Thrips palmi]|uniref:Uncharacterized protein LOC117652780 n=1 Tax=Thrips palmi TaxID=161013 RepID=A0A6P9A912_THRPL|nr:uncharacterized protein LOC117652780 [Thrips palmi]
MAQLVQQQQQQRQDAENLPAPVVESRSLGLPASIESLIPAPAPRSAADVVPSLRNLSPEQSQQNQQRLIELLTAQGGVAEVGSARSGPASASVGDSGQVRARVLSATPAPEHAEPTNERVQTRRVVVSRPIETLQEIDVVEPFTKIHRLAVNQPAVFKTAVQDVARVHTSVPVYGKALTPYTVYHK